MSTVKKMYIIASDYYDSLVQRSKITTDPIINAQIEIEKEEKKIVRRRKNADEKVADLLNVIHKRDVLKEQMKKKEAEPVVVQVAPIVKEVKKRGRPPKVKETFPEYDLTGAGDVKKSKLLDIFYMYEPSTKK
jgi:hypothetical protein